MRRSLLCFIFLLVVIVCLLSACGKEGLTDDKKISSNGERESITTATISSSSEEVLIADAFPAESFGSIEELQIYLKSHDRWKREQDIDVSSKAKEIEDGIYIPNLVEFSSVFGATISTYRKISLFWEDKSVSFAFDIAESEVYKEPSTVDMSVYCYYNWPDRRPQVAYDFSDGGEPDWIQRDGCYYRPNKLSTIDGPLCYDINWIIGDMDISVIGMPEVFMDAFWENRENLMEWVSVD